MQPAFSVLVNYSIHNPCCFHTYHFSSKTKHWNNSKFYLFFLHLLNIWWLPLGIYAYNEEFTVLCIFPLPVHLFTKQSKYQFHVETISGQSPKGNFLSDPPFVTAACKSEFMIPITGSVNPMFCSQKVFCFLDLVYLKNTSQYEVWIHP